MSIFRLGSTGDEVKQIQSRLKELGFYHGPLDGKFGGGTNTAIKRFQAAEHLGVDGIVGENTWKKLFPVKEAPTDPAAQPLAQRCLALTGAIETGQAPPECFAGLSGDFDGQGMSFGVLQWNFGQNTLQPLLKEMLDKHPDIVRGIFDEHTDVLIQALQSSKTELMKFARSIQHPVRHFVLEPWRGMFKTLGRTAEFQAIEVAAAANRQARAIDMCEEYGLSSQRGVALMFDIVVQNGSIRNLTKALILSEIAGLPQNLSWEETEVEKMLIIANRRAEASNQRWVEDVRSRKLCIARGEGRVHGINYNLRDQFGITLEKFQA